LANLPSKKTGTPKGFAFPLLRHHKEVVPALVADLKICELVRNIGKHWNIIGI